MRQQGGPDGAGDAFRFLAAACRWPDDAARRDAIRSAAARVADWNTVLEDAAQHRVMPLVASALEAIDGVPPELVARARARARRNAFVAMAQAGEALRIGAAFDARDIDWIAIKGPALALLAYGDIGKKESHDLDLLVDPRRLEDAFAVMARLGYVSIDGQDRIAPGALDHVLKDSQWRHPGNGVLVELHTRLFLNRALVPDIGLGCARESVALGSGQRLATLARPELLVYLAVHGANTNWHRLKWIADFAALIRQTPSDAILAARRCADATATGEIFDSALMLADDLFGQGTVPPGAMRPATRHARRLVRSALSELTAPHGATIRMVDWQRRPIVYLDKLRFVRSWAYRSEELRLMFSDPAVQNPDTPRWRRWTAPFALVGRYAMREAARRLGTSGRGSGL